MQYPRRLMKISVIGTGYVGLVAAAVFADFGNDVLCADIDAAKIASIRAGKLPIFEPGLQPLVEHNIAAGRLRFTTSNAEAAVHGDIIFLAVGTPTLGSDSAADLSFLFQAAAEIGRNLVRPAIIVDKSTVPVGTAERVSRIVAEQTKQPFVVVSNPEFLKEGAAVDDFMRPDRIVVGAADERAVQLMRALYAPFQRNHEKLLIMDLRSAELTKYAANAMLATRICPAEVSRVALSASSRLRIWSSISLVGSAPGDSRQMSGHLLWLSVHARSMLSGTLSTKRWPSASAM